MKKHPRQARVVEMIERSGYVSVGDAAAALAVTMQTIRRDFDELIRIGSIIRHRGGATPNVSGKVSSYMIRQAYLREVKQRIARLLVTRLPSGATIFIQNGTTLEAVGPLLATAGLRRLVTNHINLAMFVANQGHTPVGIPAGEVRRADGAIVGEQVSVSLRDYRFDIALIGAAAVDSTGAVLDHELTDVMIARTVMARAETSILVVDSTKFRHTAPLCVAPIDGFSAVVTEAPPPEAICRMLRQANVALHLAD